MVVVRSTYGCADIARINTDRARAMPGVLAVLTGADAAADGLGTFMAIAFRPGPDGRPHYIPPYPVLPERRARYVGEALAVVVAETLDQANAAAEAVEVEYEPLPCSSSVENAEAAGAPLVWDDCPGNLCVLTSDGDAKAVDRAFEAAAHVARVEFPVTRVHAAPMEPRSTVGAWDEAAQRYTLRATTQNPTGLRNELARFLLRVRDDQIRVVAGDVGGGFGLRGMTQREEALTLWAARKVGRPVRWTQERSEAFMGEIHGRDARIRAELALDKDGRFLALRGQSKVNLGAYLSSSGVHAAVNNIGGVSGVYQIPAVYVEMRGILTNNPPTGVYRGAGRPEASMLIERVIDVAARDLGMDAAELRRRNLIPPEAMPYKTSFLFTYDSGDFPEGQAKAEALADWAGFPQRRAEALGRGKLRGIGMAHTIEIAGVLPDEMGEIAVEASGSVVLTTATHSQGQGHETIMRQLMTEVLGVRPERVRVQFGDTDLMGSGFGAASSRTASVAGYFIQTVGGRIIERGKELAAIPLECGPEDVDFDAAIFSSRKTNRTITWDEVAQLAHTPMRLSPGAPGGWSARMMVRMPGPTFPNGCNICEVEIDPETGELKVMGYWVCKDVGKAINPMLVDGQVHGGVVQGLGQALGEVIRYDDEGQLLTASFMDYQMPRASDVPDFVVAHNDVPSRNNPLGIKGAGEAGTVGALPAAMNAICDALAPLGVTNFDMPATPFRVWEAIRSAPRPVSSLGDN
jgi:carbon-monoxide dehydrogenase large subunit